MAFGNIPENMESSFLESLVNSSCLGIVAFESVRDSNGVIQDLRYVFVNKSASAILKRTEKELLGVTLTDAFPGVRETDLFDSYLNVVETGVQLDFAHSYKLDGLSTSFQISALKFHDGLIITFVETTDQVEQSMHLKNLRERLELATNAAGIGVWDFIIEEDRLIWDDQMYSIYNLGPKDFDGTHSAWEKRVHPDDLNEAKAILEMAVEEKKDIFAKYRIFHPNGEMRWIEARAKVNFDSDGNAVRVTGINWDITEIATAYQKLEEAKNQAERANAAKSEFLAVMSHELRTPLNPLLGGIEILRDLIDEVEVDDVLQMMENGGRNLLSIISDILDFCGLDEFRVVLKPELSELCQLTREVCDEYRMSALEKGFPLIVDDIPDSLSAALIDPSRYQQILRNLLSNAIKFTERGSVAVKVFLEESTELEKMLVVEVIDTGEGIPAEKLDFVFEHFTQLDARNTRRTGGTGIGLAICKRLSTLMGGSVSVSSILGEGSTFTLKIPVLFSEADKVIAEDVSDFSHVSSKGKRLMIIDDDQWNLLYLESVMRRLNVEAVTESDPAIAMSRLASESFGLILLDLHMPEIGGYDVIDYIRSKSEKNSNTPVVLLTADAREETLEKSNGLGFSKLITKPVSINVLQSTIDELML